MTLGYKVVSEGSGRSAKYRLEKIDDRWAEESDHKPCGGNGGSASWSWETWQSRSWSEPEEAWSQWSYRDDRKSTSKCVLTPAKPPAKEEVCVEEEKWSSRSHALTMYDDNDEAVEPQWPSLSSLESHLGVVRELLIHHGIAVPGVRTNGKARRSMRRSLGVRGNWRSESRPITRTARRSSSPSSECGIGALCLFPVFCVLASF